MKFLIVVFVLAVALVPRLRAGDNLQLNPRLDYSSDSQDGALITGDHMTDGFAGGKPAYVILYGEGCYNSKRQARRTVSLYSKYKGRAQFVVIDLDKKLSPAQQEIQSKYYKGYIPHVVVLDANGTAVYNSSGEIGEKEISAWLDQTLTR